MKKFYSNKYFFIGIVSVLTTTLLMLVLKNKMNDLHPFRFHFNYLGDVLNLIFIVTAVISIILIFYNSPNKFQHGFSLIISITALVLLLAVFFVDEIISNFDTIYYFGYPLKKFISGILFGSAAAILLYLSAYALLKYFYSDYSLYLRSIVLTVIAMVLLVSFSFLFTLQNYSENPSVKNPQNAIAVVLGAAVWSKDKPSPIFKSRIEKAYQLYKKGIVSKIQVTGGKAPGELTESQVAQNYLRELGVDSSDIIIEFATSTTSEQIQYIKRNPKLFEKKTIFIISDSFHLERVKQMCKFYSVSAVMMPSNADLSWEKLVYFRLRESVALLFFWMFGV